MKFLIPSFIISIIAGLLAYFSSEQLLLGLAIGIFYFGGSFFLLRPVLENYFDRSKRQHECYRFVHAYVISLSANASLEKAFFASQEGAEGKLLNTMESASTMDPLEKAKFMAGYFQSDLYDMFLSVLDLYLNQGGDILKLSGNLLEELNRVESIQREKEKTAARNMVQNILLWLLSTAILVFLRFGLGAFFDSVRNTPIYLGSVGLFFLLMAFSLLAFAYTVAEPKRTPSKKKEKKKKRKKKKEKESDQDIALLEEAEREFETEENHDSAMEEIR